jgi:hypothetical protein
MLIVICVGAGFAVPESLLRFAKKWLPGGNLLANGWPFGSARHLLDTTQLVRVCQVLASCDTALGFMLNALNASCEGSRRWIGGGVGS